MALTSLIYGFGLKIDVSSYRLWKWNRTDVAILLVFGAGTNRTPHVMWPLARAVGLRGCAVVGLWVRRLILIWATLLIRMCPLQHRRVWVVMLVCVTLRLVPVTSGAMPFA